MRDGRKHIWQPIKFHPQLPLFASLEFRSRFFFTNNQRASSKELSQVLCMMAEQGPKVGDARSLWNFTPSPGILLRVFFLSLSLFARVCCDDDDDDDDVLVSGDTRACVSRV